MTDYHVELHRRISQFSDCLERMHHRAHNEVHGSCFIIFEEASPDLDTDETQGETAAELVEALEMMVTDLAALADFLSTQDTPLDLPTEGWREENSQKRFVQFSFERNWFCMDMPRQTLFRAEAEQILRDRRGFFYVADRPEFRLHEEETDQYDPFRKVYVYGDERSAAEDMAFVFFTVWKFPVDWRFFVTATAFGKETRWEQGKPLV